MLWDNHKAYFFKGDEYVRVNPQTRKVEGSTKKITKYWPGTFAADIDAVLDFSDHDLGVWFFKGDQCALFIDRNKPVRRQPVSEAFAGCEVDGRITAAIDPWLQLAPRGPGSRFDSLRVDRPSVLSLSADGSSVWAVVDGDQLVNWSLPDGKEQLRWSNRVLGRVLGIGTISSVDAGRRWVVAGAQSGTMNVFDATQRKLLVPVAVRGMPSSVALSPNETWAACGASDGEVVVATMPDAEVKFDWHAHRDEVATLCFSHDGQLLVTGGRDKAIHFWQRRESGFERVLTLGAAGPVVELRFSGDDKQLIALVKGQSALRVWRIDQLRRRLAEMGLDW